MVFIKNLGRFITYIEESLLALLLGVMVILATSQIFMRNLWESGVDWSDPLLRVLVLWLALLGAMAATRDNSHIKIDLLTKFLPSAATRYLNSITNLISTAICSLVCYHASRFVMMEYNDGIIAFADIPAWLCEIIIPIGFGLMAMRFFASAITGLFMPEQRSAE